MSAATVRSLCSAALAVALSLPAAATATAQSPSILSLLPTDGRQLEVGTEVTGALSTSDHLSPDDSYLESWSLSGRAGETVTIDLIASAFDPRLYVVGPGLGETLYDDDGGGGCNSRLTLTFLESGDYAVVATSLGYRETGTYTLAVSDRPQPAPTHGCGEVNPDELGSLPTNGRTLELGSTSSSQLTALHETIEDDRPAEAWMLMGSAGDAVSIVLESDAFDAYLHVVGPGLSSPLSDDDGAGGLNSQIDFTLPTDGPFIVIASALSAGSTGMYTISVQAPLDPTTLATVGEIAIGQLMEGELSFDDETILDGRRGQMWSLEGSAGDRIAIEMHSDDFDTYLYLLGPGILEPLFDDDGAGDLNSRITTTLSQDGSYRIVAASLGSSETGAYTLEVIAR